MGPHESPAEAPRAEKLYTLVRTHRAFFEALYTLTSLSRDSLWSLLFGVRLSCIYWLDMQRKCISYVLLPTSANRTLQRFLSSYGSMDLVGLAQ